MRKSSPRQPWLRPSRIQSRHKKPSTSLGGVDFFDSPHFGKSDPWTYPSIHPSVWLCIFQCFLQLNKTQLEPLACAQSQGTNAGHQKMPPWLPCAEKFDFFALCLFLRPFASGKCQLLCLVLQFRLTDIGFESFGGLRETHMPTAPEICKIIPPMIVVKPCET